MAHKSNKGIIITQTPFRISFLGGGTDFPEYFNQYGGAVLGTAINQHLYVSLNSLEQLLNKRIRLTYAQLEQVEQPHDLKHPIAKQILKNNNHITNNGFIDIHTYADLPAASGVGSSSSFTVGLLNALHSLEAKPVCPEKLAKQAITIEREELQAAGGWQDQIFAAYGGLNLIKFSDRNFSLTPIELSTERIKALETSMLIFFTGLTRNSAEIQKTAMNFKQKQKCETLHKMRELANEAYKLLLANKPTDEMVAEFGRLIHESWLLKYSLAKNISDEKINLMYKTAREAGAFGGKICGAGGGGFLLLIVPHDKKANVIKKLSNYKKLEIKIQHHGSKVIFSEFM